MQFSIESYRTRWLALVACWILGAFILLPQAAMVRDYLRLTGQLGLRSQAEAKTPLKQIYPVFAADALVWVRHSLALVEGNDIRLRNTTIDNAPSGREVHWNSAWAWAIAGAGWMHHLFTGQPLESSIEKATIWLNPLTLLVLTILISAWVTQRAGIIIGLVVALAMTCSDRLYEGFFPGYVDHHGLLTVAAFALMLGAVFMGAGWWQPASATSDSILPSSLERAHRAAVFSALSGACGLWVSAASAIPPVALVGVAGVTAIVIRGRQIARQGAVFDGQTWRVWGRVGAGASFVFYLLEYFPQHLSLRMEPNHPLHALAWLGAGELIAEFGERWLGRKADRWARPSRLIWPAAAVLAGPLVVVVGGSKVFVVLDPFMSRLHNDYIQEFLPLWRTLQSFDAKALFQVAGLGSVPLIAGIATLSYQRREASIVLWFATIAAALFIAMAIWQSRWLLNASGIQIVLMIVVLCSWTIRQRLIVRWVAALVVVGVLYVPAGVMRYLNASQQVSTRQISPKDASGCLSRDLATVLRSSQPEGEMTVLASPNASTGIGYYGRFKTLGTLYWENSEGLKAAARIYSAKSEQEAADLIQKHKVTHIALVFEENFIEQYFRLINPGSKPEDVKQSFGYRLFQEKIVPQWLQMIPYKVPDDIALLKPGVMLFKVNFQQTMPEALYWVFKSQLIGDAVPEAERTLDHILANWPNFYEPWTEKGKLLASRKAWQESAQAWLKGINQAGPEVRPRLFAEAAAEFFNAGEHTLAVEMYRIALQNTPTTDLASYLSWVLSTSSHDKLRNGAEALELAQQIVKAQPTSGTYLSVLSAALAELGRMPEAINAAEQAVANARLQKQDANAALFAQRLATLKSGQPLRN